MHQPVCSFSIYAAYTLFPVNIHTLCQSYSWRRPLRALVSAATHSNKRCEVLSEGSAAACRRPRLSGRHMRLFLGVWRTHCRPWWEEVSSFWQLSEQTLAHRLRALTSFTTHPKSFHVRAGPLSHIDSWPSSEVSLGRQTPRPLVCLGSLTVGGAVFTAALQWLAYSVYVFVFVGEVTADKIYLSSLLYFWHCVDSKFAARW